MRRLSLLQTRSRAASLSACASLAAALLVAQAAWAQVAPAPPTPPAQDRLMMELLKTHRDPLAGAFFTPEAVMRYQQTIGLSADQRAAIVSAISDAQPRFIEAQWQLEPETAALAEMLQGPQVNEQTVLQQIDRVLDIERQIKRIQVEMLVRIKNQLTAEQQQQLTRLGGARGLGLGADGIKRRSVFEGDLLNHPVGWEGFLDGDVLHPDAWSGYAEPELLWRSTGGRGFIGGGVLNP